jgi:hypothetical protein
MRVTICDTTDLRRPTIALTCESARLTRGTLVLAGVSQDSMVAVTPTATKSTAGQVVATDRITEWKKTILSGADTLRLSHPEWAADIA